MAQSCQCTTNLSSAWVTGSKMVTILGLPSFISDINVLSSECWFGQFGDILCIDIDLTHNWVNITYSETTTAYNARIWSNWMQSNNQWYYLINKSNNIKQSAENETKQLQIKYDNLLNEYEQMKKEILFQNKAKQSQSNDDLKLNINSMTNRMNQMKQNVNQAMQEKVETLTITNEELNQRCYAAKLLNDNLQLKINRIETNLYQKLQTKDTEINKLKEILQALTLTNEELYQKCYAAKILNDNLQLNIKRIEMNKDTEISNLNDRLQKLDKKYTNVFKQLVNRIIEVENFNKTYDNQKHLMLSNRKHKMRNRNTQFEYESLKFELNEKYNDLCKLNDYIIELEGQFDLNKDGESYFKAWDIWDVYRWIITIKNQRFDKYKKDLIVGMRKYMIYGIKMGWLQDLDLVNMGIDSPTDRACLLSHIGEIKKHL